MDRRTLVIRQGEVYWLHRGASEGSAPAGRRPALVVQHDRFNRRTISTTLVGSDAVFLAGVGAAAQAAEDAKWKAPTGA
jgi:hypothetical protein